MAILARSLDIPAVAGIDPRALDIADGTRVILDGAKGTLRMNVTEEQVERIRRRQAKHLERRAVELAHADEPADTTDGHHIEVVANIGGLDDAQAAMTKGAEGVGLLRSEFVFLERTERARARTSRPRSTPTSPGRSRPGQPLVIRTLDVGGDKPLPYLPIAPEENPFLGERGIRVGLDRPEILRTQVRAILRAVDAGAKINVMFPMIATIEDFRLAKAIFEEERAALGVAPVPVGIMVEVPSVAVMAAQFAAEVDFFSVGTNDLTQYTLAMDRGHPKLAPQVDGLNPAVLGLIAQAVTAAHAAGKWVGVCGGIASDPQAVPLLVGLGVDELSVSVPAIPAVKAQIRSLSLADCQELAARALTQDSAAVGPCPRAGRRRRGLTRTTRPSAEGTLMTTADGRRGRAAASRSKPQPVEADLERLLRLPAEARASRSCCRSPCCRSRASCSASAAPSSATTTAGAIDLGYCTVDGVAFAGDQVACLAQLAEGRRR